MRFQTEVGTSIKIRAYLDQSMMYPDWDTLLNSSLNLILCKCYESCAPYKLVQAIVDKMWHLLTVQNKIFTVAFFRYRLVKIYGQLQLDKNACFEGILLRLAHMTQKWARNNECCWMKLLFLQVDQVKIKTILTKLHCAAK